MNVVFTRPTSELITKVDLVAKHEMRYYASVFKQITMLAIVS